MILLVGVMSFTSCGDDEPNLDYPLIGAWELDYSVPDAYDKDEFQFTIKFSRNMTYEWKTKWNFPGNQGSRTDKGTYKVVVEEERLSFEGVVLFKSSTNGMTYEGYSEIYGNQMKLWEMSFIRKFR